ncbi:MAG: response regulator [Verrucomicrobiota bacterium]
MPFSSTKVLIVDDDVGLLRLIQKILQQEKIPATVLSSGAEAISWLKKNPIDLLLLDLKLQDFSAKDLIQQLSTLDLKVPFIVITGQGDERVAVEMMKSGAMDYLVKDINFISRLPTVVRHALQQLTQKKKLVEAEAAKQESDNLRQSVLNSLIAHIAVLDQEGKIISTNDAWNEFSQKNGITTLSRMGVDDDYLKVCREAVRQNAEGARHALQGIESVLKGTETRFYVEYPCHSPHKKQWFLMSVTPLVGNRKGAVVSHIDISERKRLEREVLETTEREQRRIGHDLHDDLGQQLTVLDYSLYSIAEKLKKEKHPLFKTLGVVSDQIQKVISNVRHMSHGLSPVPLESEGLAVALEEMILGIPSVSSMKTRFVCKTPVRIQDPNIATQFYRITQEGVNNAVKHSRSNTLVVTLSEEKKFWKVCIQDKGKGFNMDSTFITEKTGLRFMTYRAQLIGAELEISSKPTKGTSITCRLDKKDEIKK